MQREETKKIIQVMMATYPNWKPQDISVTINAWDIMLKDYSYGDISIALKTYARTNFSGFAPSVGQLVELVNKIEKQKSGEVELNESEAWALVLKALKNSAYNSVEEYERLPKEIQKAVGSPINLKEWAVMEDFNVLVASSNFKRVYNTVLAREKEHKALPNEVRQAIKRNEFLKIIGE